MPSRSGEARLRSARGAVRPGCLLGLLLVGLGVYAGAKFLGSEMDYRSVQEVASREARLAESKTDQEIREEVLAKVQELGLPPSAHDVRVRRLDNGRVRVSLAYPDTLRFLGRWEWVTLREISVQGPR